MDPVVVLGAQKLYRKLAHLMTQILNIVRNLTKRGFSWYRRGKQMKLYFSTAEPELRAGGAVI